METYPKNLGKDVGVSVGVGVGKLVAVGVKPTVTVGVGVFVIVGVGDGVGQGPLTNRGYVVSLPEKYIKYFPWGVPSIGKKVNGIVLSPKL